jgi:hypothetical protein
VNGGIVFKIALYFVSLEISGLIGFIMASFYQEWSPFRLVPLLVALVAIGYVAFSKAGALSCKEITCISIMASAGFVLVVQILGFTVYPGLAKDLEFLSGENAARTGLLLIIGIFGHFLLLLLAHRTKGKMGSGLDMGHGAGPTDGSA